MNEAIRHEPDERRFVIDVEGGPAYISYREVDGRLLDLASTFVPRQFRGSGIASRLTAHALGYAREHGYRVVPTCPFVAAYIERHPEYRELLA
jgi:predicted GNAT family acetyltransferase